MKYYALIILLFSNPAYATDSDYGDGGAAEAQRMYEEQTMDNMREQMQQEAFRQEQAMREQQEQYQRHLDEQRNAPMNMSPAARMGGCC